MHAFFSNLRRIKLKFHQNPSITSSDIPQKCKNPVPGPGPAPPVRHLAEKSWHTPSTCLYLYKCIGDNTKAAVRQSPNCIKNTKKIKYGFNFDHITAVNMSFCTSLRNFVQIGPPTTEKITSCRFSRWRISKSSLRRRISAEEVPALYRFQQCTDRA